MASTDNRTPAPRGGRGFAKARAAFDGLRSHAGFWLKALSQPTIDLTLRTQAGQRTRIVESPGVSLPKDELDALVGQLRTVAAKTLPEESLT